MNAQVKSDQELVRQYILGQEAGLTELVKRYKSRILSAIYRLVKDRYLADDIYQETFAKVIQTLRTGQYNEEGKFFPWVVRIAHNIIIDHYRKEKRLPEVMDTDACERLNLLTHYEENAEERIIREQTYNDLRVLMQLLPADQKEVLLMRHYGELSFKEIATVTGVSINTALGRMRYALIKLRKMMEDKDRGLHQARSEKVSAHV